MHFVEVGTFEVVHGDLPWPWIAIDARSSRLAFASSDDCIATRAYAEGRITEGPSFALPADVGLGAVDGFSIDPGGTLLAVTGTAAGASVVVTVDEHGEQKRSRIDALAGGDFAAHAVAFDRSGTRLWISAESADETAILLVDARSHALAGVVRSAPFPRPASHELHVHPQDDAVLLLAACGQEGTFARVVGWSDGPPLAVTTPMDGGSVPVGFVGFSADGARVHLVELDELRTHAWPGLLELSSVELADDFVSSYAGVVLGHRIFVDGEEDDDSHQDAVMAFDRSAIRGSLVKPPVPSGMWVGRLGTDALVTVESKGDPALARVIQLPAPPN